MVSQFNTVSFTIFSCSKSQGQLFKQQAMVYSAAVADKSQIITSKPQNIAAKPELSGQRAFLHGVNELLVQPQKLKLCHDLTENFFSTTPNRQTSVSF